MKLIWINLYDFYLCFHKSYQAKSFPMILCIPIFLPALNLEDSDFLKLLFFVYFWRSSSGGERTDNWWHVRNKSRGKRRCSERWNVLDKVSHIHKHTHTQPHTQKHTHTHTHTHTYVHTLSLSPTHTDTPTKIIYSILICPSFSFLDVRDVDLTWVTGNC